MISEHYLQYLKYTQNTYATAEFQIIIPALGLCQNPTNRDIIQMITVN